MQNFIYVIVQDHPHIHGEHPVLGMDFHGGNRITPIYMGSTLAQSANGWFLWDHPHIHGEHAVFAPPDTSNSGSPPYTWGAPYRDGQRRFIDGITPIYMGSTPGGIYRQGKPGDHPHIHGEHPIRSYCRLTLIGSPPYTWGALMVAFKGGLFLGITPIYMGSTWLILAVLKGFKDHPHIHGEHAIYGRRTLAVLGSPPYTWGALIQR